MDKFINENSDTIDQGGGKNPLSCFIAVAVDINCKQDRIGQERNTADRRQQRPVGAQNIEIFSDADRPAENPKIINEHCQERAENAQENTEF